MEPEARAELWGRTEGRTIITLTVARAHYSEARIADAIKYLQKEYPGAEIQVRGLDGKSWEKAT